MEPSEGLGFFKKPSRNKNIRKRPTVDEADAAAEEDEDNNKSAISTSNRNKLARKADGRLGFSSGTKQERTPLEVPESKRRDVFVYESTRQVQTQDDSRATAAFEMETAFDRDNRALRERVLKQASEAIESSGGGESSSANPKVYKGINGYVDHKAEFRQEHTISREKAGGAHGPLRGSAHIRMTVGFDYQPDVCKEFKETGYSGYGDSCKSMHDRGDYKSGWQMEREWDQEEKVRKQRLARGEADTEEGEGAGVDSDAEDALPFACFTCREPFTDPVVTQCKHYFCEHCALKAPGDIVLDIRSADKVLRVGSGLRQDGDSILATKVGRLRFQKHINKYWVEGSQKRYIPNVEDTVVGVMLDRRTEMFILDIGGPAFASLPILAFEGATRRNIPNLQVGAAVYARVVNAHRESDPELSCTDASGKSAGFGPLKGGYIFDCSTGLSRGLLSKPSPPVLEALGKNLSFEIAVGLNGRVWVNAPKVATTITVSNAIQNSEFLSPTQQLIMA